MKWIKFYIMWLLYLLATFDDRYNYFLAKERGMKCNGTKNGTFLFFFPATYAEYDPNQPPQKRNYMNFKEYKELWYPCTGRKFTVIKLWNRDGTVDPLPAETEPGKTYELKPKEDDYSADAMFFTINSTKRRTEEKII